MPIPGRAGKSYTYPASRFPSLPPSANAKELPVIWKPRFIVGFCLLSFCLAGAAESLHFDFNDSAHLGAQAGSLPAGTVFGPVSPSATAGAADFQGGVVKLPGLPGPPGPFSIEARFRIRHYGPESSRFIADILTTATWNSDPPETDNVPTQGFAFRTGGSYLYPVLPANRYANEQERVAAQQAYSEIDRGKFSVCYGTFVIARRDVADWKSVYTDRCIELGAWTHMAAVWDGQNVRIYMNGLDATDTLRLDGVGAPTRIDSVLTAYVGGRSEKSYDPRRFDGDIDFVRLEDRALSPEEIHARYKETFVSERRDSLCQGVVIPAYPEAGQVCQGSLRFEIKVAKHGACTDPAFIAGLLSGDSVEIEVAKDPSFDPVAIRTRFAGLSFEPNPALLAPLAGYEGPIYWRVRLIPSGGGNALAKSAATVPEWSPSRPILLDFSHATIVSRPAPRLVRAQRGIILEGSEPALFDLSGKRVPARFRRIGEADGSGGAVWRLEWIPEDAGVLLAR